MSQDKGYKEIKKRHDLESRIFTVFVLAAFAFAFYLVLS